MAKKKKKNSDDTIKFLFVLMIAGIAIALIFFLQPKEEDIPGSGTPASGSVTPGVTSGLTPSKAGNGTSAPTKAPSSAAAQPTQGANVTPGAAGTTAPTQAVPETPTPAATPTETPVPTPTPVPLSVEEAEALVCQNVDTGVYKVELLNDHLGIDGGEYYQFGISENDRQLEPFLIVAKKDGKIYCYNFAGSVSEFVKFPLDNVSGGGTQPGAGGQAAEGTISVEQAYEVLCTYSPESLGLAKAVKEFTAEYGTELTLVKGVNCYRINLTELSGGKVRNRGEFYISVDGKQCFTIDNDLNDFIPVKK